MKVAYQEKLNGADMTCHLIEVLSWWHNAALYFNFPLSNKSVGPV